MKNLVRLCLAFGCVAIAACSPATPPADSGVTTDTGTTPADGGATDSGVTIPDVSETDGAMLDRAAACTGYCTAVTRACTGAMNVQYPSMMACETACNAATYAVGTNGMTTGNTIACRTYHAGAAVMDPATHCPHAGPTGGGVCQ
jgi:hypothetical protein